MLASTKKLLTISNYTPIRLASTHKLNKQDANVDYLALKDPVRQVFISQSNDVFTNLALEDWLYRNHDFKHKHLLVLWRNDPCVVIGRHQNPWSEANIPFLRQNSIDLARRNSGGGTVFHDLGNINCTFFTRKDQYRRRRNLDVICNAIKRLGDIDVCVNERDDIVVNNTHKISGTAAKLGRDNAYHHCTVLVDSNTSKISESLSSPSEIEFESRSTQSVRVPVTTLKSAIPHSSPSMTDVLDVIGSEFLRTNIDGVDTGLVGMSDQRGFQMIKPDDQWFPGLSALREELVCYDWIFAKTPLFKIKSSFEIGATPLKGLKSGNQGKLHISIEVKKGKIETVSMNTDSHAQESMMNLYHDSALILSSVLHGKTFAPDLIDEMKSSKEVSGLTETKVETEFIMNCICQMIKQVV